MNGCSLCSRGSARCAGRAAPGRVRRMRGLRSRAVRAVPCSVASHAGSRDVGGLRVWAGLEYDGVARSVMLALKAQQRVDAARALAPALAEAVRAAASAVGSSGVEVVAVPGTRAGYRRRGYDPVRLLIPQAGLRRAGCSRRRGRTARGGRGGRGGSDLRGTFRLRRRWLAADPDHRRCGDHGRQRVRLRWCWAGAAPRWWSRRRARRREIRD